MALTPYCIHFIRCKQFDGLSDIRLTRRVASITQRSRISLKLVKHLALQLRPAILEIRLTGSVIFDILM